MAKKEEKKQKEVKKHFFKDFKAELKKVIWPTPKQLINSTIAVVVIVLITSAIVFVLDVAFKTLNEYGIKNLQSVVKDNFAETTVIEEQENATQNNEEVTDTNQQEIQVEETNTGDEVSEVEE